MVGRVVVAVRLPAPGGGDQRGRLDDALVAGEGVGGDHSERERRGHRADNQQLVDAARAGEGGVTCLGGVSEHGQWS